MQDRLKKYTLSYSDINSWYLNIIFHDLLYNVSITKGSGVQEVLLYYY